MHTAAYFGNLNAAKILLDYGADVAITDSFENRCLSLAAQEKWWQNLEFGKVSGKMAVG